MDKRQDKMTLEDSHGNSQDDLAKMIDEKASLGRSKDGNYDDPEMDEKAAMHQAHQDDLDDLLSDIPPLSGSPDSHHNHNPKDIETQSTAEAPETTSEAKPSSAEFEHIFEEYDKNDASKDIPPNATVEATSSIHSSSKHPSADGTTTETHPPSLADFKRTAEETRGRDKQDIPFDFNKFLEQMRRKSARPIVLYFKSFLSTFDRRPWAVNDQIRIIHRFMDFIHAKMRECEVWRDLSDHEFENAKEGMEKLVMNRLYNVTFSPNTTDDKERDEIVHQKISIFRWIREEHLDIPKTANNELFIKFAETELLKINNYKAPRDKLICILNCCKVIFGLIKQVEGDESGADKFLPVLIYVVIRANPPQLVSNVQYISRFRNPEYLQSESGYYLTNLLGSISFIESMDTSSLSITKEEFDANIERTVNELEQERPSVTFDKQKISYDNAIHPSRALSAQAQPLIDPVKAAALIEKGSSFAQKTMQKPLNFVGKIFQGLNEGSQSSDSQDEDDYPGRRHHGHRETLQPVHDPRAQQYHYDASHPAYQGYAPHPYAYQPQTQHHAYSQPAYISGNGAMLPPTPNLPQRPLPIDPRIVEARRLFDVNLQTIITMFPNVEPDVCFMVLQANGGQMSKTVDALLEISDPEDTNRVAEYENLSRTVNNAKPNYSQGQQYTIPPSHNQPPINPAENTVATNVAEEEELIKL